MDALGPRFERFLAAVEPDRAGRVIACEAITGGYSRISARARVRWRGGAEETFILRGDPAARQRRVHQRPGRRVGPARRAARRDVGVHPGGPLV